MAGVLATPAAVLAQPDAIGVVALALIRLVIAVLALLAGEGDSNPNVSAGHVLSLRKRFTFRVWTKKNPAQTRGNGQFSALAASRRYGDAMPGNEPPSRRARARGRGRAERASRTRIQLRRAGLAAALGGIALLLFVLLGSAGSHRQARTPRTAAATRSARPRSTPAQTAPTPGRDDESAEVRRLIALGKPIYCAAPHGNEVALTFDDGPGPYTQLMIDKLRKHGVRATFFIVGRNIPLFAGPGGAPIVREERTVGAVGDHTFTHPLLTSLAPAQAESEIVRTQRALAHASRGPVFLFRPPYGAHDAQIDAIARAHGLLQILWTVDSRDSLGANYAQIERNVISGLRPGAIVLMHENHGQTIRAMLSIFAALERRHLRAVSVPQLLRDDPPSLAQLRAAGGACGIHGALSGG
jgi:peptidoglycan-N-acetylglucosamine deacetylase